MPHSVIGQLPDLLAGAAELFGDCIPGQAFAMQLIGKGDVFWRVLRLYHPDGNIELMAARAAIDARAE